MGTMAPAANFLHELNNMLYRERQSAKEHDRAMGDLGLRTATFKYQMEQDMLARKDRQAARAFQQKMQENQMKLQQAEAARQQELFKNQIVSERVRAEKAKKLITPVEFNLYNPISRTHPAWQDERFIKKIEDVTGGKFNRTSGFILNRDGSTKKMRPMDMQMYLPGLLGLADTYKDTYSDKMIKLQDLQKQYNAVEENIAVWSGHPGGKAKVTSLKKQQIN